MRNKLSVAQMYQRLSSWDTEQPGNRGRWFLPLTSLGAALLLFGNAVAVDDANAWPGEQGVGTDVGTDITGTDGTGTENTATGSGTGDQTGTATATGVGMDQGLMPLPLPLPGLF